MSMLDVGARCSTCSTVDFLPTTCQYCSLPFCQDHILSHGCTSPVDSPGPSRHGGSKPKDRCEVSGCDRPSIEALGGKEREGSGSEVHIAREIRCPACGGAFCTSHRQQAAHSCPGPNDHTIRQDAALARKAKAQEILVKTFPAQAGKTIAKPPPPRSDTRTRPKSPQRLPPSLQPHPDIPGDNTIEAKKTKTRAEKMHEIQLRKLRSLAKPLDPKQRDGEKRFFEWAMALDQTGAIKAWRETGRWDTKTERVWVNLETPIGKILDIMISQARVARPSSSDPSESLGLIALSAPPDQPRSVLPLSLSSPASLIPEGSLVLLVKKWLDDT